MRIFKRPLALFPLIFVSLLGCVGQQTEWQHKNVDVDPSVLTETVGEQFKTKLVVDLDTKTAYHYGDDEDLVVADFKPTSVYDDEPPVPVMAAVPSRGIASAGPEFEKYTIKEGDTLMLISWARYGMYEKWKEIHELNPESQFAVGDEIWVPKLGEYVAWNPGGEPYFILYGDTLSHVSLYRYETSQYWRDIWDHNKVMIKDPNLIFAGFTIYTAPLSGRNLASGSHKQKVAYAKMRVRNLVWKKVYPPNVHRSAELKNLRDSHFFLSGITSL